ncbi:MAG: transcriptional repressor [bacterium]|jgi:Fe2+ or Zn2+ uptake regulation protein
MLDLVTLLQRHGIQPTPQRLAVADFILGSRTHPSADQVLENVRRKCPTISRATVYNTLNLLAEKGLVKTQLLKEGTVIFDSNIDRHHHFIDEETGQVYDIPWEAVKVTGEKSLKEFEIREFQVIMRGRKKRNKSS